jgi:competence protein ComEC
MVTWALMPLTILFFGPISVVGWMANLLAIPWVTLMVTPLAVVGVMWSPLLSLSVLALSPLKSLLGWMAALLGGWVVATPWPWPVRYLDLALWLPALAWSPPRPVPGHFEMQALDLGQGNAVLVHTAQDNLLYEAGPRYFEESDAGPRVVVPILQRLDLTLEQLVLSHRVSDHTGRAAAVLALQPSVSKPSSLEPEHALLRALRGSNGQFECCEAGQSWQWGGVRFKDAASSASRVPARCAQRQLEQCLAHEQRLANCHVGGGH